MRQPHDHHEFNAWRISSSFSSPERRPEPRERYDKAFRANRVYGKPVGNSHTVHGATSPIRPKNILVILAGRKPHTKISMIVNKRSVLSMEQLILDVSKSLGKFFGPQGQNLEIFGTLTFSKNHKRPAKMAKRPNFQAVYHSWWWNYWSKSTIQWVWRVCCCADWRQNFGTRNFINNRRNASLCFQLPFQHFCRICRSVVWRTVTLKGWLV